MPKTKKEFYLKIIFLISLVAIISAYYIEFILGYQPCNLCLIERIPYALALIILIINFKFKKNEKFLILLLILIFFFSLLVSIYHFGIEQGFFQESLMCDVKNSDSILSKEELLLELQKKQVSCKDVTFKIFGLSLTSINILISLILLSFLIKIFIFYEKIR
tara:strand:- start:569 stop:1054 length:486 start_codon:yes stop_codon:yes gene_type:complete